MRKRTQFFGAGAGGGGTPSLPLNSVQFNNGGAFGGVSGIEIVSGVLSLTSTSDADQALQVKANSPTQTAPIADFDDNSSSTPEGSFTFRGVGKNAFAGFLAGLVQMDQETDSEAALCITNHATGVTEGGFFLYLGSSHTFQLVAAGAVQSGGFAFCIDNAGGPSSIEYQTNSVLSIGNGDSGSGVQLSIAAAEGVGFHGAAPVAQATVTGSRGGNAALASLLTTLATKGLIVDGTTA